MSSATASVSPSWLRLREAADGAARSTVLADLVQHRLPAGDPLHIHDLGSGTGAMGRWLAPRLARDQHWYLYDRDAELLDRAAAEPPTGVAEGRSVTLETRQRDITRLDPDDVAGASLITASALLDMLTADELERLVTTCAGAGCPTLVALSVIGRVELVPSDPFDGEVLDAFNAHQRRTAAGRRLLGPDAVGAAVDAFAQRGQEVVVRSSPWHLGPDQSMLTVAWLRGWVDAAVEQRPELAVTGTDYARARVSQALAGRLRVTVHHHDMLAWPR